MPLYIEKSDITEINADAIVNAANMNLLQGGGVCGAIFSAAGAEQLQAACNALAPIKTGEAVITPGFALQAKYIIHAAGPIYRQWKPDENKKHLRSAYINSLKLAIKNGCESIAFPLISSGIYGYPKEEALQVATEAIRDFLVDNEINVTLVIFDKQSFVVSKRLAGKVQSYIKQKYKDLDVVIEKQDKRSSKDDKNSLLSIQLEFPVLGALCIPREEEPKKKQKKSIKAGLDDLMRNLDEPFSESLLKLIDAKGKTDSDVYKKANIDRKHFSKIRTGNGYTPTKRTVLALAVSLELSFDETEDLLSWAGYALSYNQKFDVIVSYFISNKIYDIFEINNFLFSYDQPLLGS